MKKKTWILIVIGTLLLVLLAFVAGLTIGGLMIKTGTYLESDSGISFFVTKDGELWRMNGEKGAFDDLESGDKILTVMNSAIAESYPARCYVKLCFDIGQGDGLARISQADLLELRGMGYCFDNSLPLTVPEENGEATDPDENTSEHIPVESPSDRAGPSAEELAEAEAILGCSLSDVDWNEYVLDEGYILFDSAKNLLFVWPDGSFAAFENRPELPAELESGDRILILRMDMILETYPGQIVVSHVAKTEDGSLQNIPRRVVEDLINECGYKFDFELSELKE